MDQDELICPKCNQSVDEILEFILIDGEQKAKWYQCRTCYDKNRQNWEMACFN